MVSTQEGKEEGGPPGAPSEDFQGAPGGVGAPAAAAAAAQPAAAAPKREAEAADNEAAAKRHKAAEEQGAPGGPPQQQQQVLPEAMRPLGSMPTSAAGGPSVAAAPIYREDPAKAAQEQQQQQQQQGEDTQIAPGVLQLAPFGRNAHASVAVSRPSLYVESLPPQGLAAAAAAGAAAAAAAMGAAAAAVGGPCEGGPLGGPRGVKDDLADTPADRPPVSLDPHQVKQREEEAASEAAAAAAAAPVVPSCSSWFSEGEISSVERDILPSLFTGSSVLESERDGVYVHLRQSLMDLYRQNPQKYLSFTECRQSIPGDAALLLRVYCFLDYWGLINFQANPATVPSSVRRKREFLLKDMQSWSRASIYEKLQQHGAAAAAAAAAAETSAAPQGEGPWRCVSCGKICLYSYYILKPGGTAGVSLGVMDSCVWCLRCYAEGRYPHVLTSRNFVKVDLLIAGATADGSDWQLDEIERLIEAIELHKDDWDEVAEHVGGGRTPQQCVERFIKLPTQEPFLEASKHVVSGTEQTPFSSFANPLLSLLAFLSSVVHPSVAAAAARAALQETVNLAVSSKDLLPEKEGQAAAAAAASSSSSSSAGGGGAADKEGAAAEPAAAAAAAAAHGAAAEGGANGVGVKQEAPAAAADGKTSSSSSNSSSSSSKELLVGEEALQVAAATALAAGAASAAELQQLEQQNIGCLLRSVAEVQMRRVSLKLKKLQALQEVVARSKQQMENRLSQLFAEHSDLMAELEGTRSLGQSAVLP
ncbi:Related to swi/snf-related matrix-associated actin-dependent regulator of chromatin, subfamily c, member 1, related [Eimeria tenella]|uniref:Related to swi/snf-related matrix-associated actin-dependent regulator of chromatin, subfamily c, member 1, related n=1 Tax=Eimeria tenella TaxID=5802 RepID=U6L1R8_EIMTE|nr:Related to swi/snf-related matrix-associated actin-dependent regulator of chromatin, subfamily c, member 1, related [Eimeria tenella]CDJ41710.1 Related to swi/snf-related matrix-associated actin-dependent regulator of chromatin, subfamily c, member 1, related [Eimeria tenella]|eukprot:XP_013232460.1 Related to swi/snf-related matrix-associated actin-dependent regulator of chromatin, subfamily c, member 1, related [Eimeria tenella]